MLMDSTSPKNGRRGCDSGTRWNNGGGIAVLSVSGKDGLELSRARGSLVMEIAGGESGRRRRGRTRERSEPSALPEGLAAREVDRDTDGRGGSWSGALLNRLMRSLKEDCRDLIEPAVAVPLADGPPRVGESDVERWTGCLVREAPGTFAGSGDTRSLRPEYLAAMLLLPSADASPTPGIVAKPSCGR